MRKIIFAIWLAIASLASLFLSCEPVIKTPRATILDIEEITDSSVVVIGELISDGGAIIMEMGAIVYPDSNVLFDGEKTFGRFTVRVTGLIPNTEYKVGVYATNIAGQSLGSWINFRTKKVDTTTVDTITSFGLPGTRMTDVITDSEGSVYVAGTFGGVERRNDCFIAKFNPEGGLVWRNDIVTEYFDFNSGTLLIDEKIRSIYIHTIHESGLVRRDTYLNSYNIDNGELKWRKQFEYPPRDCNISSQGNIFVSKNGWIEVIDSEGEIINQRQNGPEDYHGIAFWGEDIWLAGNQKINDVYTPLISKFNKNFEKQWSLLGESAPQNFYHGDIEVFPDDSIIVVTAAKWGIGYGAEATVSAYQGLLMKKIWEKQYPVYRLSLTQAQGMVFISSPLSSIFSVGVDLTGKQVWKSAYSEPSKIAFYGGKVFSANTGGRLLVGSL